MWFGDKPSESWWACTTSSLLKLASILIIELYHTDHRFLLPKPINNKTSYKLIMSTSSDSWQFPLNYIQINYEHIIQFPLNYITRISKFTKVHFFFT
jgi:hypothetical protein